MEGVGGGKPPPTKWSDTPDLWVGGFFDAFWSPVGSLLAPFGLQVAPFGLPLAPFRLTFATFWLHFAPFWLPLARFWHNFG